MFTIDIPHLFLLNHINSVNSPSDLLRVFELFITQKVSQDKIDSSLYHYYKNIILSSYNKMIEMILKNPLVDIQTLASENHVYFFPHDLLNHMIYGQGIDSIGDQRAVEAHAYYFQVNSLECNIGKYFIDKSSFIKFLEFKNFFNYKEIINFLEKLEFDVVKKTIEQYYDGLKFLLYSSNLIDQFQTISDLMNLELSDRKSILFELFKPTKFFLNHLLNNSNLDFELEFQRTYETYYLPIESIDSGVYTNILIECEKLILLIITSHDFIIEINSRMLKFNLPLIPFELTGLIKNLN